MPETKPNASKAIPFAATDMLHRRVPLTYRVGFILQGRTLLVTTNSLLLEEALNGFTETLGAIDEGHAEWEIAVEVQNGALDPASELRESEFELHTFGPSRALRMDTGSWFAYTPPSLSGVGFAMVAGNECHQTSQLAAYLKAVMSLVANESAQINFHAQKSFATECEVTA
jgi:hypothetical protein